MRKTTRGTKESRSLPMSPFYLVFIAILSSFVVGTTIWAWISWRAVAHLAPEKRRWLRGGIVGLSLFVVGVLFFHIASRMMRWEVGMPALVLTPTYLWFFVIMPASLLIYGLSRFFVAVSRGVRQLARVNRPEVAVAPEAVPDPSRRAFLQTAIAAGPPLILLGTSAAGYADSRRFRLLEKELVYPNLPADLDGFRIVHLSDTHSGKFTTPKILKSIGEATANLNPDMVVMTGDLIDHSVRQLPDVMAMLRDCEGRYPTMIAEGNHDLFEGRENFENGVMKAGFPLLLNEGETIRVGESKLRIVGLRWGIPGAGRGAAIRTNMEKAGEQADSEAFNLMLAHHPHAFDEAAEAGFDLTLAGHTHGGQMNILPGIGPGALMFRYHSGLYRQGNSKLFVSNGAGAWFPLRLNAPAEVVALTLRKG